MVIPNVFVFLNVNEGAFSSLISKDTPVMPLTEHAMPPFVVHSVPLKFSSALAGPPAVPLPFIIPSSPRLLAGDRGGSRLEC